MATGGADDHYDRTHKEEKQSEHRSLGHNTDTSTRDSSEVPFWKHLERTSRKNTGRGARRSFGENVPNSSEENADTLTNLNDNTHPNVGPRRGSDESRSSEESKDALPKPNNNARANARRKFWNTLVSSSEERKGSLPKPNDLSRPNVRSRFDNTVLNSSDESTDILPSSNETVRAIARRFENNVLSSSDDRTSRDSLDSLNPNVVPRSNTGLRAITDVEDFSSGDSRYTEHDFGNRPDETLLGNSGDSFWRGSLTLSVKYDIVVDMRREEAHLYPVYDDTDEVYNEEEGPVYSTRVVYDIDRGLDSNPTAHVHHPSSQVEQRLRGLEDEKQTLTLQVSVLNDQVDAQKDKIQDLELCIEEYKNRLVEANDILQEELLTRSSLEHHKLDLMAEVSGLKMRLASAEKSRREMDDKYRAVQRQVAELEAKLVMKDAENSELRLRLGRNGTLPMEGSDTEVEKLRRAVDTLMLANDEKERKLEDMRRLLKRYRRVEEILIQAQGRKAVEELLMNLEDGDTSSNSSSTTPSVGDTSNREQQQQLHPDDRPDGRHYISSPSATSTPVHQINESARLNTSFNGMSSPPMASLPPNSRQALGMTRSNSCENIGPGSKTSKTPSFRKKDESPASSSSGRGTPGGYANTEVVTDDEDGLQHYGHAHGEYKKKKGLRRLFGRLKRSSSQDFEGSRERGDAGGDGEFRRGGIRATASARLAWNRDVKGRISNTDIPFTRWDTDRVTAWMNDIGLNMYLVDCKRYVRNGEHLLRCSQHDLEKELGIKNFLHRKKLQLAMQAIASDVPDRFYELDHNFVARWLDDIGLPQYKDVFYDARVDGRMLNNLTVEDLLHLKVTSEVHHVSIKRGIQILRLNNFSPNCLRRRPTPEEQNRAMKGIPGEVVLWTTHRVMEWLRTIDLSEYAPNLRGSGVHGALMILEPRFNSELFAILLSIPPSKTLLRRHLNTHFISLVGPETQTRKREHESQPGYVPLLHNSKVKHKGKFGLFGHKRSRSETEAEGFLCPPELNGQYMKTNGKGDEKAAKEIGAFSQEINSLTTMLSHERFMDSAKTSNV